MSLINREALYEKACDLEAQALSYVGKIANDETKIDEWRIWSAILTERTAFKHDVFDAPDAQPERTGKWIYGESECGNDGYYCDKCGNFVPWKYGEYDIDFIKEFLFCNKCGARMES